ncbi:MAG TPA: hypothetical protein ENK21_01600, partial [Trueperaceae bacterium]|nr:hypothetical protein [Trueperaceae bacterium]
MFIKTRFLLVALITILLVACNPIMVDGLEPKPNNPKPASPKLIPNPIVFISQFPIQEDFTTITSTFGNHLATMRSAGRGGDLMIIYPDGSLKNLTKEAGYGMSGLQTQRAIAVRDPEVHWDGKKVIFSMIIGAPSEQYDYQDYYWQIYEISNLAKEQTPVISKLANQPSNYNNISPIYTSDDKIIFTSDRPRDGQRHLYPQLDEYEETPTVSGLWRLEPSSGRLELLDHAPSGAFSPIIDSFGRVIYTRWDHLQRDQQADSDAEKGGKCEYCAFNYSGEGVNSVPTNSNEEVFPEPRESRKDLLAGTPYTGHFFNHFFPWMMNQDGTNLETLNHVGRHELHDYFNKSRNDDPALQEGYAGNFERVNQNSIENLFEISEDSNKAGRYLAINAPEFGTHGAGQIVALYAPPNYNADKIKIDYLSNPETSSYSNESLTNTEGLYR